MFKTKALCILDKASIFASARNTQPGFSWRTMEVKKIALMKRLLDDHTMLAEMEKFQIWEDLLPSSSNGTTFPFSLHPHNKNVTPWNEFSNTEFTLEYP